MSFTAIKKLAGRRTALLVALGLAATSAIVLFGYVHALEARSLAGAEPVDVLVAKDTIRAGTLAEAAQQRGLITTLKLPRKALIDGAVLTLDEVKGRSATVDILRGEQISQTRFVAGAAAGLLSIPSDRQAISVDLTVPPGGGGFVQPGDRVSVIGQLTVGETVRTQYLVQNVPVLAVGHLTAAPEAEQKDEQAGTVQSQGKVQLTLALPPSDAEKLVHAQLQGQVWFTVLPPGQQAAGTRGRTSTDVFAP